MIVKACRKTSAAKFRIITKARFVITSVPTAVPTSVPTAVLVWNFLHKTNMVTSKTSKSDKIVAKLKSHFISTWFIGFTRKC